jgi:hypothetical protein
MSTIKISSLVEKVTMSGTEEVLINDSGTSKKFSTQRFLDIKTGAETAETNAAASAASVANEASLATTNGAVQVALATTQASLATTNGAVQVALATTQATAASTSASGALASQISATTSAILASALGFANIATAYNISTNTDFGTITSNISFQRSEFINTLLTMSKGSSTYNNGAIT